MSAEQKIYELGDHGFSDWYYQQQEEARRQQAKQIRLACSLVGKTVVECKAAGLNGLDDLPGVYILKGVVHDSLVFGPSEQAA